jgi:hypothetical protein
MSYLSSFYNSQSSAAADTMLPVTPSSIHGSGNTTQAAGSQVRVNQAVPLSGSKLSIAATAGHAPMHC